MSRSNRPFTTAALLFASMGADPEELAREIKEKEKNAAALKETKNKQAEELKRQVQAQQPTHDNRPDNHQHGQRSGFRSR